jgi:hypothetical protein
LAATSQDQTSLAQAMAAADRDGLTYASVELQARFRQAMDIGPSSGG